MRIRTHEPSELAAEIAGFSKIEIGFRVTQVAGKVGWRVACCRTVQGIAKGQVRAGLLDSSSLVGDCTQIAQPVAMLEICAGAGVGGQYSKFLSNENAIGAKNSYGCAVTIMNVVGEGGSHGRAYPQAAGVVGVGCGLTSIDAG